MATSTPSKTSTAGRAANWRNLALTYVVGVLVLTVQSVAYNLHTHDNKLSGDIPFYVVSGLVGVLIAALALFRVHRAASPKTAARVGIVLSAFGIAIFAVAYYMPITFILGGTSYLFSRDAEPSRAASVARILGIVAMLCSVAVAIARICGVSYQVGG